MDQFSMAIESVRARIASTPPPLTLMQERTPEGYLSNFTEFPAIRLLCTIESALKRNEEGETLHQRMSLEDLVHSGTFSETSDQ
jgi:hypothetical protein